MSGIGSAPLALAPVALALLGVLLGGAEEGWRLELSEPRPTIDGPHGEERRGPLEGWEQVACVECHRTIGEEWSRTLHALAWVDPRYREEIADKRRPKSCHGCHIPKPLHGDEQSFGKKPKPRSVEQAPLEHGITCVTCHQAADGAVLGPFGAEQEAHASRASEHFRGTGSNALCLSCHQTTIGPVIGVGKDFRAARLEERGMSCVACHMQPLERPIANGAHGANEANGDSGPARAGRSHLLQTARDPGFLSQAFDFALRVEAGRTVLRIENRAGHRIPGLLERSLSFEALGLDAEGAELARGELVIDSSAYLPVLGEVELRLEAEVAAVHLRGLHQAPGAEEGELFLELELRP